MAGQDPVLCAQVRVQYCEWLLTCRGSILPCNGDNIEHLSQALLDLSTYTPPATPQQLTAQPSKPLSQASRGARGTSARAGAPGRKVSVKSVVAHAEDIVNGVQGARHLDEVIRVCILWSILTKDPVKRLEWLLHAARCAAKMAVAALTAMLAENAPEVPHSASAQPGTEQGEGGACPNPADSGSGAAVESSDADKAAAFAAPNSLRDWLLFSLSPAQLDKILKATADSRALELAGVDRSAEQKGVQNTQGRPARVGVEASEGPSAPRDSFTAEAIRSVDRTCNWLKRLREELQQHACAAHCLPVMWLRVLLCAQTSGRGGACVGLFELSNWLQQLGLSHQAESCRSLAGVPLVCTLQHMLPFEL